MEFFRFCLEIIRREAKKFNVGIQTSTATQLNAANADDFSYDNAHNRCTFLYRCGTINLAFSKDCFSKFLLDYSGMAYLLAKWRFDSYLTFCSIGKGPALDYVSLLLSHEQCRILSSLIGNIRVITKYGAWRNTANIMLELINEGYFNSLPPSVANIEVTQGDPFTNFTDKVRVPINDSDLVTMIKALNLQSDGYDKIKISKAIQEFTRALKPGAVLFCIDTKPSINEITEILSVFPGKYLLKPTNMNTMVNFEYTELYKDHFGCLPIVSGRGYFFVWEKSMVSHSSISYELKELPESVKCSFNDTDMKCHILNTDETNIKSSCDTFSKELNNCNQKLSEHIKCYSTPKSSKVNNAANTTLDIGSNNFQLEDNSFFQKSSYSLPSTSLTNVPVSASNLLTKENLSARLNSSKSQLYSVSNTANLQTEPEKLLKETEVVKITELTNKITDLTMELTKFLENNTLNPSLNDASSKNSEEMFIADTEVGSLSCQKFRQCSQKLRTSCCCSKKCAKYQSNLCCSQNTFPTTAQLVIPLNSLSADVVHQIISLITPANQISKSENC